MKSVKVTYRTLKAGPPATPNGEPTSIMLVKTAAFTASPDSTDKAGYSVEGPFLRVYGGGRTMLLAKAEVLEVDAEE